MRKPHEFITSLSLVKVSGTGSHSIMNLNCENHFGGGMFIGSSEEKSKRRTNIVESSCKRQLTYTTEDRLFQEGKERTENASFQTQNQDSFFQWGSDVNNNGAWPIEGDSSYSSCENKDFLDEIDENIHYQLDVEIHAFRTNLHSILSQQQQTNRLQSPLQIVPQLSVSTDDTLSSECMQSSSSTTDHHRMDDLLSPAAIQTESDVLIHDGNDVTIHGSGNDTILHGSGNDTILHGSGNDTILHGSGNDTILHGSGNVVIEDGSMSQEDRQHLLEGEINRSLIHLQTIASLVTNNLRREEYTT